MLKHLETILTGLGVAPEDISVLDAVPEAEQETFDVKPFAEKVRTNFQTQFKNDPAFFNDLTLENLNPEVRKTLERAQYGRAATITRDKLLKGLGMTEADYADLTTEEKEKLELFVPKLAEKYAKAKAGDKQLQADLIDARKKIEQFEGLEDTLKTKYESESSEKVTAAIFKANLISELAAIPGLKIAASDIAATAANILNGKYAFERVNEYGIELRNKEKPTMKVLKGSTSQELTLKDALMEIATERGWVEKQDDKAGGQGAGKIKIEPNGKGSLNMIPPHLQDKIGSKISAEK